MQVPTSSVACCLVWLALCCVVQGAWSPAHRRTVAPLVRCLFAAVRDDDEHDDNKKNAAAAQQWQQQAAQLRDQVQALEQQKRDSVAAEQRQLDVARAAAVAQRARYSAIVPILKPDGSTVDERCDFAPRWRDGSSTTSFITTCVAALPLGVILGESEDLHGGAIVIDDVTPGGNGQVAGLQKGDLVRAFTACQMTMETPTWQLMAGGIGIPKTTRFMYSVDHRPFDEVLSAVASNRQDPQQRPMVIVVERKGDMTK